MDEQALRSAQVYQEYIVGNVFSIWTPVTLEYAQPQVGESVLDVACGTGAVARDVAPLVGKTGRVVGVDLNQAMLAVARSLPAPEGATIEWREGDAAILPDCCFDLVTCQQGLQFFAQRAQAVREMRRVLVPEGRAVVSVWQGLDRQPVHRAIAEAMAPRMGLPPEQIMSGFAFGDVDQKRALFEDAGFREVQVVERTAEVRFPSAARFVELTVASSAAVLPNFAKLDDAARASLVAAVNQNVDGAVSRYVQGDALAFPMSTHIVLARA